MNDRRIVSLLLVATGALVVTACKPAEKPAAPAETTEVAAPAADVAPAAAPAAPALFAGIAGADRVPASLIDQMATETARHWARCGDEMVAKVVGADGKDEGFIIARGVSFQSVDAAIDVPSQKAGNTARQGINLRSSSHVQYFGEGVSRTDVSGRTVTKAGWSDPVRLTAPLPHWRADETNGAWTAIFRPNATDAAEWTARYQAADCAAVPPGAPAS